ncbi:hypothetical protein FQN55_001990 [Onygenales sp. PD_40]|nr:hypothetical protein FQN55_001990 [Onygenales sp. PD_40]KAK2775463.1 hypothetical protein FQN53_003148 [Emmonsiellopsis sp. PD_33]KAK2794822.1 hypothetical protein FQN51_000645 [Onygenales sp. PD_10]KAK2795678.1 hypothetical protein FQN52_003527 [Onygenales sp. PD_12]
MWSVGVLALSELLLCSLATAYPQPITAQTPIELNEQVTTYPDFDDSIEEPYHTFPSWDTTHLLARRLLALSTTGVLSTVYPSTSSVHGASLSGIPIGLPDYIADCANDPNSELADLLGPGNPLILALNIGTTFRNTKAGSNISLSLDWWHSSKTGDASLASLPRVSLLGTLVPLENLSNATREAVEGCFVASHPDAKWWLPGHDDAAHSGYWAKLDVKEALWIGGFGDRARIGWLVPEAWKAVRREGENGKEGWADVKLPGE